MLLSTYPSKLVFRHRYCKIVYLQIRESIVILLLKYVFSLTFFSEEFNF